MKTRTWNPAVLLGIALGASRGAVAALILLRRLSRGTGPGLRDIRWRDVITLVGPIVALTRRLIEMSRRELVESDMQ